MKFNHKGEELPDNTPIEVPLDFVRPLTIHEEIARALRTHDFQQRLAARGMETPEEAEDFDVDDDNDPITRYEAVGEGVLDDLDAEIRGAQPLNIHTPPPPPVDKAVSPTPTGGSGVSTPAQDSSKPV